MRKRAAKKETAPSVMPVEKSVQAPAPVAAAPRKAPTQEEIGRRAYEIYVLNGSQPGRDLENWLQAEQELSK